MSPVIPTHQANDILIMVSCAWHPNTVATMAVVAAPANWTEITAARVGMTGADDLADGWIQVFWRRATAAGMTCPLIRPAGWDTGTDGAWHARPYVIRGCVTTGDPWDDVQVASSLNVNGNLPAVTVSGSERMVVQFYTSPDDQAVGAAPSGWTAGTSLTTATGTDGGHQTFRQDNISSSTSLIASSAAAPAYAFSAYAFIGISFKPPVAGLPAPPIQPRVRSHGHLLRR